MGIHLNATYMTRAGPMSGVMLSSILDTLRILCRSDVLRTEEEHQEADRKKKLICKTFGVEHPEDLFDRYDDP